MAILAVAADHNVGDRRPGELGVPGLAVDDQDAGGRVSQVAAANADDPIDDDGRDIGRFDALG